MTNAERQTGKTYRITLQVSDPFVISRRYRACLENAQGFLSVVVARRVVVDAASGHTRPTLYRRRAYQAILAAQTVSSVSNPRRRHSRRCSVATSVGLEGVLRHRAAYGDIVDKSSMTTTATAEQLSTLGLAEPRQRLTSGAASFCQQITA